MSQRSNAPYSDKIRSDGITIEYEGHDIPRTKGLIGDPKHYHQVGTTLTGKLTQNGLFAKSVDDKKSGKNHDYELVKVYEKILPGIWSVKGFFNLIDYKIINDGRRNVYHFTLKLFDKNIHNPDLPTTELKHSRIIPSEVKKAVWKRDGGKCVLCGSSKNLHFDHELPFSKGGSSLTAKNIRILCAKCNLAKSDKIE
jgi:hypothetical protein